MDGRLFAAARRQYPAATLEPLPARLESTRGGWPARLARDEAISWAEERPAANVERSRAAIRGRPVIETSFRLPDRGSTAQTLVVAGGAAVFLLACAGLGNMALGRSPPPADLRNAAVVAHLASVLLALPLGASQLLLPKGTIRHRTVGYIWLALMVFTALVSFAIHAINPGGLSPIHVFSVTTLVGAPFIALSARRGEVERHRRAALGVMGGGLVIAGLFTFIPGRVMGDLLLALLRHG
jgi:uncharacterized membrane protein